MMKIRRYTKGTKFRVILNGVHFYTTVKMIRTGEFSDSSNQRAAVQKALDALEFQRSGTDILRHSVGLSGTWEGHEVQLTLV